MKAETAKAAAEHRSLSHFGPEANVFDQLEGLFRTYGETGNGKKRYYIHSDSEARELNARLGTNLNPGQFTFSRTGPTTAALTVTLARTGTATSGTDFAAIAMGFGIPSLSLEAGEWWESSSWQALLETDGPALISFRMSPEDTVSPHVPGGKALCEMLWLEEKPIATKRHRSVVAA